MDDIEYTFEEVPVTMNGIKYYATGSISVNFYEEQADPSVGLRAGAVISHYDCLAADLYDEDGHLAFSIHEEKGQIVNDIANALNEDSVLSECESYLNG